MLQTLDESGYLVTFKPHLVTEIESDIIKGVDKEKGRKHPELKLWIKDLRIINKNEEMYYTYSGILVNIVDIYGVIVAIKRNNYGTLYQVDDGTGEVGCWLDNRNKMSKEKLYQHFETSGNINISETSMLSTSLCQNKEEFFTSHNIEEGLEVEHWLREEVLQQLETLNFNLGNTVHLRGKLADFRGERCIRIYNIRLVTYINEEIDRRLELMHLYETVYSDEKISKISV